MRQTKLWRLRLIFLILFGAVAQTAAAEPGFYQVISPNEQFLVYCRDPALAQEVAIEAEEVRSRLFEILGWAGFSQFRTEIWIVEEKPAPDFPSAQSSVDLIDGAWKKKITAVRQERLKEEVLTREIIAVFLTEMANEAALFQKKKKKLELTVPPVWMIEGLRARIARMGIEEPARSLEPYDDLKLLLQRRQFFKNPETNRPFAAASSQFVDFLLGLPGGKQRMKEYIKTLGKKGKPVYNWERLQASWREEAARVAEAVVDEQDRRQRIQVYLDALDVE